MKKNNCFHSFILKKQLFKNKTIHIVQICDICGKLPSKNQYLPKTKENLIKCVGWKEESEETKLLDELLGLSELKGFSELKTDKFKKLDENQKIICGNCKDNCGDCKIKEWCPCHWP